MAALLVFLLVIASVFSLRQSEFNDAQFDISNLFQTFQAPSGFFFPATALRLGFHDSGTWSEQTQDGGPHGTQVFNCLPSQNGLCEKTTSANAGLGWAVAALETVYQAKYTTICSRADFWQIAALTAIEDTGGPSIPFRWGRKDSVDAGNSKLNRLPGDTIDNTGVKSIFGGRLALTDRETVAILGAHTIGHTHAVSGHGGHWEDSPFRWDNHYYQSLMIDDWRFAPAQNGKQQQWEALRGREILVMLDPDFSLKRILSNPSQRSPYFSIVQFYSQNEAAWNTDFISAWKKITERGSGTLRDLCDDNDPNCDFVPSQNVVQPPPPPPTAPPKSRHDDDDNDNKDHGRPPKNSNSNSIGDFIAAFFRGGRVTEQDGSSGTLNSWAWALLALGGIVIIGTIVLITVVLYQRRQSAARMQR